MKNVFISYSEKDKDIAAKVKAVLEARGIIIKIDSESLVPGMDIRAFIDKSIRETDVTLSIVSKNSLLSDWVALETVDAFLAEKHLEGKMFIGCYVDEIFFDRTFVIKAVDKIDKEIKELEKLIRSDARKMLDPTNLQIQKMRKYNLRYKLPTILDRLNGSLTLDIREPELEKSVRRIIDVISINSETVEGSNDIATTQQVTNYVAGGAESVTSHSLNQACIAETSHELIKIENRKSHIKVSVFFGTDRNVTKNKKQCLVFGSDRSNIKYGKCDISIPLDHKIGELESPSIWRLEMREDQAKHVVLLKSTLMDKAKFFQDISAKFCESQKNAFLFIHGYNVTFRNAARRTAQMAFDLNFKGVPMFYSWPSKGRATLQDYLKDEQSIEWAEASLRKFLEDIFQSTEVQNIYLIAHSMGNRALTGAVNKLLNDRPDFRNRLKEVILAAPDIDADVFKRDIVPELIASCGQVTLYASSRDRALVVSNKVHGHPRAGDSGQGLIVCKGIETIDATHVDTSLLGHSYYAESRSVLSDMYYLISLDKRADKRFGLRLVETSVGPYWEFEP